MQVYHYTLHPGNIKDLPKFDFVTDPKDAECILVTGGDGTILHSIGFLIKHNIVDIPILGFNLGHVGFLSNNFTQKQLLEILTADCVNTASIEERTLLQVTIDNGVYIYVLNDCVFQPTTYGKLFELDVIIDNKDKLNYKGDGLIVATATGSTAYNLSAGGPIMNPLMETILLTPICPFTLAARTIVLNEKAIIDVYPKERCVLSCDGITVTLNHNAKIKKAPFKMKLLKYTSFYEAIQYKLGWNRGIK